MKDTAPVMDMDEIRSRLRNFTPHEREDVLIEVFRELLQASLPEEPQKDLPATNPRKKDRKPRRCSKSILTVIKGGRR